MECARYRRSMLADPGSEQPELRLHAAACSACARYSEALQRFETRLGRALRVDVAADSGVAAGARQRRPRRMPARWLAVAASLLLGVVVAGGLWLAAPGRSLAADVVGHMADEPDAWAVTAVPVPGPQLEQVLRASQIRLRPIAGVVSYANSCLFRGHLVPHLVVQTAQGPVTVMVLPRETSRMATRFDERGYRGMILPMADHGSLAVLERGPAADPEAMEGVAAQVRGAIEWTG